MNTKPIPAILALLAGFFTCIMSFVQGVDITVFAKRFIIVCIVFFIIGMAARLIIEMNFRDILYPQPEEEEASLEESGEEPDGDENEDEPEDFQEEYGEYTEELDNLEDK